MKINTNNCTVADIKQCEVKVTGRTTVETGTSE